MAYHIKNMRMVTKSTAAETIIAVFYRNSFSITLFRHTLPRESPYRRKSYICCVKRLNFSDRFVLYKLFHPRYNRIIMHFKLNLTNKIVVIDQLYHFVILVHIKCWNLHRQDMYSTLCTKFHLAQVFAVFACQHNSLDSGMSVKHFRFAVITRNPLYAVQKHLLDLIVRCRHRHPVKLGVIHKRLIILSCMSVSHTHHCNFYRFHN